MTIAPTTLSHCIPAFSGPLTSSCLPTASLNISPSWPRNPWTPECPKTASLMKKPPSDSVVTGTPTATWRLQPGCFVAFALDVATIARMFEEDQRAYNAIRNLRTNRFLGLVVKTFTHNEEGKIVEEALVNFVAQTLPPIAEIEHHHLLLEPNAIDDLVARGPPLKTIETMPWPDLIQWTTLGARIVVETFHESAQWFVLQDEELDRLEDDIAAHYDELEAMPPLSNRRLDQAILARLCAPDVPYPAEVWRDIRMSDSHTRESPVGWLVETGAMHRYLRGWQRHLREEQEEALETAPSQPHPQNLEQESQETLVMLETFACLPGGDDLQLDESDLEEDEEAQVQQELMDFDVDEIE